MKCTKTEYFHTVVATLQAIFRAVKHVIMLIIMFLNSEFIFFFRIDQVLRIFTKNNGFIRNDIEGNVLFYRVVRVIPH